MIQKIINKYKSFIEYKGWTHARAAEEIGCCRAHMSRIFNGQRMPSITLLNKMEKVMEKYNYKE
jgi:transcriptional regulator with XRE-family HTH domain